MDQLPVHGPDFAASLGSLLVIHKPNDARKFVPDLFKKRPLDQSQGSAGVDCKEFPNADLGSIWGNVLEV